MLEKTYQPNAIEARIHEAWQNQDAFKCGREDRRDAEPYCIVIPPPNVTGSLHMGHALNNTLQDILCRYQRLLGKDVLWQPGTDHAGIATQLVVTQQLAERQINYKDLGRKSFLDEVWSWKAQSGGIIVNQLKRLGASCDWSRERFTMDDGLSRAVIKVFVDLHRQGLIYKDKRLVNWDPEFQSAVSDLEVEPRDHIGSFKWSRMQVDKDGALVPFDPAALSKVLDRDSSGHMYYIRYPIADTDYDETDSNTYITVGTTRPETMLGDTGVAIHPDNENLGKFIGKRVRLPLCDRDIPIVGDVYADPEKGTGAVKITPAHDFNDWDVGKRAGLDAINILQPDGTLNENAPAAYRGLDRFEARKLIVADLAGIGMLEKIEPHSHAVPHAQRGDAIVEPYLTDQWYVDAKTLAAPALAAVRAGKTRFVPERYANDYFMWLDNIQPWCISRQLWWGHQIPAWYDGDGNIFVAHDADEAQAAAKQFHAGKAVELTRDEDVLDTWFSSGLWPFSTLGWPDDTPEVARYYPTSVLVTGFDIIFFWVARMMMMGLHFKHEIPFHDVYIHALVRDEKGNKMSKTRGNVIDPLALIEEYGADALRFTLAAMAAQGRDIKLATSRVEGYRNFATKLWNAARFAEMNECVRDPEFDPSQTQETVNQWIVGETERARDTVTRALNEYKFNEAATAIYEFVWGRFCDWYVELTKPILNGDDAASIAEVRACTAWTLDQILKLLHPFMPFITEELWTRTGEYGPERTGLLTLADWPACEGLSNAQADDEIGWIIQLVSDIRSVRAEMRVPAGAKIPLVIVGGGEKWRSRVDHHDDSLRRLARLDHISFADSAPSGGAVIVVQDATVALPLADVIDMAAERARLEKEVARIEAEIKKIDGKLANANFVNKAPAEVVEENRERRSEYEATAERLRAAVACLDLN